MERADSPARSSKTVSRGSSKTNPIDGLSHFRVYCKAVPGEDGTGRRVVACPYTQEVRLVLGMKKVEYALEPVLEKPEWLQGGQLPCVAGPEGEEPMAGADVAYQIDARFPRPRIDAQASASSGVFCGRWPPAASQKLAAAVTKYLRNTDDVPGSELEAGLAAQLGLLNDFLREARQPFLAGAHAGLPDCQVAPMLQALQVAAGRLKDFVLDPKLRHVHAYLRRVLRMPLFVETSYAEEDIVKAWAQQQRRATRRLSYQQLLRAD